MYNINQIAKEIEITFKETTMEMRVKTEAEGEKIMIKYERIANGSSDIPNDVKNYINERVRATLKSVVPDKIEGNINKRIEKCFRETEAILYKYNSIKEEIRDCEELIGQIKKIGLPGRSKSIVRYNSNGTEHIDKDEQTEKMLEDIKTRKEILEAEMERSENALRLFEDDPYNKSVTLRYMRGMNDIEIAESMNCDAATVWRNRQRIIKAMAVYLYGVRAVPVENEYDRIT